jgi:hypothetical protein
MAVSDVRMQIAAQSEPQAARGRYSRLRATSHVIDNRSFEGRFLAKERAELVQIAGGKPSLYQKKVIEEACRVKLRLELIDRRSLTDPDWTERDARERGQWSDRYQRLLAAIEHGRPPRKHERRDKDEASIADLQDLIGTVDG